MSDRPICEVLDWDSRHFGLKIGRVTGSELTSHDLGQIDQWRRSHGIDCLYLLAGIQQIEAIRLAELAGFGFTDLRVTLDRALPAVGQDGAHEAIRPFQAADLPALKQMARELHRDSRFHVDTRFPQDRSEALFATWLEKACGDPGHRVFVADVDGRPAGYIACQRVNEVWGQIQLVGVDTTVRNKGLGRQLVDCALNWLATNRATHVTVVTQGRNITALRLYQKRGFLTSSIGVWYHWWRNP